MRGLQQLQLRIFDQIGRLHYYLGNLQKARQYHSRHINALHQPASSALRQLSKQRILKCEQLYLETRYRQIDRILLVHLKVPIKSIEQVPLAYQESNYLEGPIRKNFSLSIKYFAGEQPHQQIKRLFKGWFFRDQIEDPSLPEPDWSSSKPKKHGILDFQLNQQLKKLQGQTKSEKKRASKSIFPVKQSLQQQISRIIKEPPLQSDWYQKIVKQINRDHRNKLLNVRNAVRIRGFNKKIIPTVDVLKDIYNSLFERSNSYKIQQQNATFTN